MGQVASSDRRGPEDEICCKKRAFLRKLVRVKLIWYVKPNEAACLSVVRVERGCLPCLHKLRLHATVQQCAIQHY